jgi:hypothetical protein
MFQNGIIGLLKPVTPEQRGGKLIIREISGRGSLHSGRRKMQGFLRNHGNLPRFKFSVCERKRETFGPSLKRPLSKKSS